MAAPVINHVEVASLPSPVFVPNKASSIGAKPSRRIPALDGLRGLAILLVLLRHSIAGTETTSRFLAACLAPLRLAWSGVDLFFVLSGFLIGGILLDARASPRYYQNFYLRRVFRIFPVYYAFLALYFMRHLPIRLPGALSISSPLPIPWFSFVTFTHNFWMASFGWFGPWVIAPTWSLAIEEQFYLVVPALIRLLKTRTLYFVLILTILGAPLLRAILPHLIRHGAFANYVLMPCRADALSMGVLAALLYRNGRFRLMVKTMPWALNGLLAITGIGILLFACSGLDQYTSLMAILGFSCIALFYTCVLLLLVCGMNPMLEAGLRLRPIRWLGTVSYSTYLAHPMLMQAARMLLRSHTHFSTSAIWPVGGIAGVAAALILASMSWKYFESPVLRRAHRYTL